MDSSPSVRRCAINIATSQSWISRWPTGRSFRPLILRRSPGSIRRADAQALSDVSAGQIWLQMAHRLLAALIGLAIAVFWLLIRREKTVISFLRNLTNLWLGLVILQIALGRLDNLEQQGGRYRHRARGGRGHYFRRRDRHFCDASASPACDSGSLADRSNIKSRGGGRDMKTAVIEPPAVPLERSWTMADLAQLVKARLTFLVLVTTAVGFYARLAGRDGFLWPSLHAVLGTALAAAAPRHSINGGNTSSTPSWCAHGCGPIPVGPHASARGVDCRRVIEQSGGCDLPGARGEFHRAPFLAARRSAFTSLLTRRSSESAPRTRWSARSPARSRR